MIDPQRPRLSIVRQCLLLHLNRSGVYYQAVAENATGISLSRGDHGLVHAQGSVLASVEHDGC